MTPVQNGRSGIGVLSTVVSVTTTMSAEESGSRDHAEGKEGQQGCLQ